jgi:hypothetical protein
MSQALLLIKVINYLISGVLMYSLSSSLVSISSKVREVSSRIDFMSASFVLPFSVRIYCFHNDSHSVLSFVSRSSTDSFFSVGSTCIGSGSTDCVGAISVSHCRSSLSREDHFQFDVEFHPKIHSSCIFFIILFQE